MGSICHNGSMARKGRVNSDRPKVALVATGMPDAQERLRRAYDLILGAAARADSDGEQSEGAGAPIDEGGDQGNV